MVPGHTKFTCDAFFGSLKRFCIQKNFHGFQIVTQTKTMNNTNACELPIKLYSKLLQDHYKRINGIKGCSALKITEDGVYVKFEADKTEK